MISDEIIWLKDEIRRLTIISPVSYCGNRKLAKNARFLYALCVEIDNLVKNKYGEQIGFHELLYQIEQERLPRPTYIVASGNGLHLYYKFIKPVPCFDNIKKSLWRFKKQLTKKLWNRYVTYDYQPDRIQYESVFQGFRMVGTRTKAGDVCRAFRTGEPVTIEYLNQFAAQKNQIIVEYQTDLPLSKAKELYPEWYQRRIVEGDTTRGHWVCNRGLYDWWLNRIMYEAGVGHRYYCLMCLSVYAVKCGIPYEELERDAYSLLQRFELLTDSEENHFTEKDVEAALDMYRSPDEQLYTYTIAYISAHSGIPIERNKRNGRSQAEHAKIMRFIQSEIKHNTTWNKVGNGRHNKAAEVAKWRADHIDGKKADCIRDKNGLQMVGLQRGERKMNGYKLMAASYKKYLEQHPEEPDEVKQQLLAEIKVNELLAGLSEPEIMMIFDSGAFNQVIKSYCYKAMEMANIAPDKLSEVRDNIGYLLETTKAGEVVK
jgi:hypothetical protein